MELRNPDVGPLALVARVGRHVHPPHAEHGLVAVVHGHRGPEQDHAGGRIGAQNAHFAADAADVHGAQVDAEHRSVSGFVDAFSGDVFRDEGEDADARPGEADFLLDGGLVRLEAAGEAAADFDGFGLVLDELDAPEHDDGAEGQRPVRRAGGVVDASSRTVKQARGSRRRASILWPSRAPWK